MLKILVVDDDYLEVQSIRKTIDFNKFGITEVYDAFDSEQAKTILMKNEINILLCDIEMPHGSGLELLNWVRENEKDIECIFITSHAEFKYAKKAIELGSIGYILKPVMPYELNEILKKTIDKIMNYRRQKDNSYFSSLWFKYQPFIIEKLWQDILSQKISKKEEIKNTASAINLPGMENMKILPILIRIQLRSGEFSQSDESLLFLRMKNIAYEVLLGSKDNGILIEYDNDLLICIVYIDTFGEDNLVLIENACEKYIETCSYHLKCNLSCCIGEKIFPHELVKIVQKLSHYGRHNIACNNQVLRFGEIVDVGSGPEIFPDMNSCLLMLRKGYVDQILYELEEFLKNPKNKRYLNSSLLTKMKQDYMQIIHTFLKDNGIKSHLLFYDNDVARLFDIAEMSVEGFIRWLKFVLIKARSFINMDEEENTFVERAKEYIKQNCTARITREDVAGYVYLNPDYLTRIFKKETGMFISEYLIEERIKLSKKLLIKTDMNVTDIAMNVGYGSNISYFSLVFKKKTGMTPVEYRKLLGNREKEVI